MFIINGTDTNSIINRFKQSLRTRVFGLWLFLAIVVILLVFYQSSVNSVAAAWLEQGPYSHGFLTLVITVTLMWQERRILENVQRRINWWALSLAMIAGLTWWLAGMVAIQTVQLICLFVLFCGVLANVYGVKILRRFGLPLVTILLVLPIWEFLQPILQTLSIVVTHKIIQALHIPVLVENFRFTMPGGQFVVDRSCSGLGFFMCSMLLGVLYIHFNHIVGTKRFYLVSFAMATALVSNWIRITLIMVVGNQTKMNHPIVEDHLVFGWVVFSVMLVLFFLIAHHAFRPSAMAVTSERISAERDEVFFLTGDRVKTVLVGLGVLMVIPLASWWQKSFVDVIPPTNRVQSEISSILETARNQDAVRWSPQFQGASSQLLRRYTFQNQEILCLVIQYDRQEQGRELIYVDNSVYSDQFWSLDDEMSVTTNEEERSFTHNVVELHSGGRRRLIVYWYLINHYVTSSPVMAKLYGLIGAIKGDRSAYMIALAVDQPDTRIPLEHQSIMILSGLLQTRLSEHQ